MAVKLRTKKLKDGSESIYLDIYLKGSRRYEFLGLTYKKNDPNRRNIKEIAEKRRSQVELENFANAHNLPNFYNGKEDFIKYFESKCKDESYKSTLNIFKRFVKNKLVGEKFPFNKLDEKLCEDFKEWLFEEEYKNNSVWVTVLKLKTVLNLAVKEKIIPLNPAKFVKVKLEETEKIFLTVDELKKMYNTDYKEKDVKRAFLFACYTGLRLSDIKALTWKQIRESKLYFIQQKTKGVEYLPLSETASKILYDGIEMDMNGDEKVFKFPTYKSEKLGSHLRNWAKLSKVDKYITFHSARHTFGTLLVTSGVEILAVKKLMGHKSINSTLVYAKIIDAKLNEAVNKLPTI